MHRGPRLIWLSGILFGLFVVGAIATERSHLIGSNYAVYLHAAEAVRHGESIYSVTPPGLPGYHYLYPPGIALVFLPITVVDPHRGFVIFSLLSVAAGLVLARTCLAILDVVGIEIEPIDRLSVSGFCLLAPHVVPTLAYGNVNLFLAAGVAGSLYVFERRRSVVAGALLGAVASVKLFPALIGIWFVRMRSWRVVAGAIAVGSGVFFVGLAIFGWGVTVEFFIDVLLNRADEGDALTDPARAFVSINRPLARIVPIHGVGLIVLSMVVLAPFVAYVYTVVETTIDRLVAAFVTVAAAIVVVPSFFTYYPLLFYPLVPLAYALTGRPRLVFVSGAAIANVTVTARNAPLIEVILPGPFGELFAAGITAIVSIATGPLIGVLTMLFACCWYTYERRNRSETSHG